MSSAETRAANAALREDMERRRASIEAQISAVLEAVTTDPNASTADKLEAARLSVELYKRWYAV